MEDSKQKTNEASFFNENLNISYIDENSLPTPDKKLVVKHYLCSVAVYGTAYILLLFNPFFSSVSTDLTKEIFKIFYLGYILIAPIIYFYYRPKSLWKSHNIEIFNYIKRVFLKIPQLHSLSVEEIKTELESFKPSYLEKQSLMLIFIKFFFGVLMVSSFTKNLDAIIARLESYSMLTGMIKKTLINTDFESFKTTIWTYKDFLYNNLILFLFTIDLSVFCFGYLSELSILKNKIRSVETTAAGLFFCLICYPPFIAINQEFIKLPQNDNYAAFGDINSPLTWICRIPAIIFLIIYVCASIALGTKASNLTNRGTVSKFPYNIVRHPAYISKNMFWLLTIVPMFIVDFNSFGFNIPNYLTRLLLVIIAMIAMVTVYYFRALTEERHLIKDPEYQEYTKKVKYRFIPFII